MSISKKGRTFGPRGQIIAVICGAIIWGLFFAVAGHFTDRALIAAVTGAILGAIIGYGFAKKVFGGVVVWITVFAFLGMVMGPGCDAHPLPSALGGAALGAFFGFTGWYGVSIVIGALIGVNLGAGSSGFFAFISLGMGAFFGWAIVHALKSPRSEHLLEDQDDGD